MRFRELKKLFEMSDDALKSLKSVIASKIKELPIDDVTIKTLREIEDLLRDVNAGGRKGLIDKDLKSIEDPAVHAAQKMLSRYILSIDSTPEERNELFSLWKNDKIVNKENLFSGKSSSFADIFNGYSTNSLIQELVNDLMNIATLGHGKGEFALNVLSKDIYKPSDGKGDLKVRWNNNDLQVEVKTSSETITIDPESGKEKKSTSSARFGDQEVRPAAGWDPVARELNDFVRGTGSYKSRKGFKQAVPTSGLSLKSAILVHQSIDNKDKSKFIQGDITSPTLSLPQKYHIVFTKDTFEHILNPWDATQNVLNALEDKGIFIFLAPFSWRYHASPFDTYRYTHTGARYLFERLGKLKNIFAGYIGFGPINGFWKNNKDKTIDNLPFPKCLETIYIAQKDSTHIFQTTLLDTDLCWDHST
jgi:SAM-dependent methyltransferase